MEQRITRAKGRIAKAGVTFGAPGAPERAERVGAVAAAIYLMFNEGYSAAAADSERRAPFSLEAIRLARLLLRLFPAEPEIMGLTALLLLQHARLPARFDAAGEAVLLERQDRSKWSAALIAEGLALMDKSMRHRRPGPYQLQAAIAALHARASSANDTDWAEIELLYRGLERLQPSPVVTLNRAVAVWKVSGPEAALALTSSLEGPLAGYFYLHALRGALMAALGRHAEAREAYGRAIALAGTAAEASHIRAEIDALGAEVV